MFSAYVYNQYNDIDVPSEEEVERFDEFTDEEVSEFYSTDIDEDWRWE